MFTFSDPSRISRFSVNWEYIKFEILLSSINITSFLSKFAVLILLFIFSYVNGQNIENYNFKSITVNDNLSHSDVNTIVQDLDGYLWIATNNGLNRYDGYEIKTFKSSVDDTTSLPGNRIRHMVVDDEGYMWIYIENLGLYSFDPRKLNFKKIHHKKLENLVLSEAVFSSFCSHASNLLIYDGYSGIINLKINQGQILPEAKKIRLDTANQKRFISFTETDNTVLYCNGEFGIFEINRHWVGSSIQ